MWYGFHHPVVMCTVHEGMKVEGVLTLWMSLVAVSRLRAKSHLSPVAIGDGGAWLAIAGRHVGLDGYAA